MDPVIAAIVVVIVAAAVGVIAYRTGSRRPKAVAEATRLEEYEFYPFVVNENGHIEFSSKRFQEGVDHFLTSRNPLAAQELIVIGEQNFVRDTFGSDELGRYKELYAAYDGDSVISDNEAFLENYKRIVTLVGRSFPKTGVEILLHNLVNPSKSVIAIENGEVTGRTLEMGTTNLVLDLKTRRHHDQDKLNYELNIGSRQFKCTTVPIFRAEYGLVGAICINVDARFLREEVMPHPEKLEAFFDNLLRTDLQLDENILSRDEYQAALSGKRHFLDEAIRAKPVTSGDDVQLAAILFSDIVDYTSMMTADEAGTLRIVRTNGTIHRELIARFRGRLLKEMGDGVLASFASVGRAVDCARELQKAAYEDGRYRLRIGIHLGEVVSSGGDVFGDGVNIASRIQAEAEPGTIAVSDVVYDNVKNKDDIVATDLGERALKNVPEAVRLFAIDA